MTGYSKVGWQVFPKDPALDAWLEHAVPAARAAVADPANRDWLLCEGTWFAGVGALDSDGLGRVAGSGPLEGAAAEFARGLGLGPFEWDTGQVSVVWPGYPRPREGESATAFRYRRDRDAAHLDGLLPTGPERRRMLKEPHAFIMGLPLNETDSGASPMTVWEGSHELMRERLGATLRNHPPQEWAEVDLTEVYHAARKEAFASCRRVKVHARPGEAYLVHRLALHGVSPWEEGAVAPEEGRAIAYFRPELRGPTEGWIVLP